MKSKYGPKKGIARKGNGTSANETSMADRSARKATYTETDLSSQIIDGNVSECDDLSSDDGDEYEDETRIDPLLIDDEGDVMESDESEPDEPVYTYTWRKTHLHNENCEFQGSFSDPPIEEQTPLQYFRQFVTDEMLCSAVDQSNLYSVQKDGKEMNITKGELEQFLGIFFKMGLVQMSRVTAYWEKGTRFPQVADTMSRNRFQTIMTRLHFKDNESVTKEEAKDKCWKVRPWMEGMRKQCLKVEPGEHQAVDEMMVPFKGRSYLRQYMPKKPTRYGFKMWVRVAASGIVHDFDVYSGSKDPEQAKQKHKFGLGGDVVLQLCSTLPSGQNFKIFADNFFTNLPLVIKLKEQALWYAGTIRKDRVKSLALKTDKELKTEGRESLDFKTDLENDVMAVKWCDNNTVLMVSTYVGVKPLDTARRWDRAAKKHVDVDRPAIIREYNKFMGGIDLMDSLLSLYKMSVRSKRWYMYIWYHMLQIACVNAWLLYSRHADQRNEKRQPLRLFQADLATSLMMVKKKRGRPSLKEAPKPKKRKSVLVTTDDVRTDALDHWPLWYPNRSRCKYCKSSKIFTFVTCSKCKVALCLNKDRNCFVNYHHT